MSCWVVPSVAADLWGVSVDHVLARMREGAVPARTDAGFQFVDVAPESPVLRAKPRGKPRTWEAAPVETAHSFHNGEAQPANPAPVMKLVQDHDEDTLPVEGEADERRLDSEFRDQVRSRVGSSRRPPGR